MSESHWERVAFPLLEQLVETEDTRLKEGILEVGLGERGREKLGLKIDEGELFEALFQLQDLGYIEFGVTFEGGPGAIFTELRVTGRGLQVLGQWPWFEAVASPVTLAALAERAIAYAPADDRARLERAANYLRTQGPEALKRAAIVAGVALIRGSIGLP